MAKPILDFLGWKEHVAYSCMLVTFTDDVYMCVYFQPSSHESYIPFMPNVLKVFLENGQTKSFKYDSQTCVKVRVHLTMYNVKYLEMATFLAMS